jgi:acyl-coenzyme A synthetase/AMP-(fatty) acid ligase
MPDHGIAWDSAAAEPWKPLDGIEERIWLLHTSDPLLLNAVLRRGLSEGLRLFLAPAAWSTERARAAAADAGATGVLSGSLLNSTWTPVQPLEPSPLGNSFLGIFTSGTTGRPKLVLHAWHRVSRNGLRAAGKLPRARWLMAYQPASFAGLQVFFAAEASGGQIFYPRVPGRDSTGILRAGLVDVVSATPTWWRMLIAGLRSADLLPPLTQATLGGERVDQSVIDLVEKRFRPKGLTHIYASTEAGSAIAVSDRREGFPASWLEDERREILLRIREGFLEVNSPWGMQRYADGVASSGWLRTPDLVERVGDRVLFRGRADAVVNVGGAKVMLEEVERAVMAQADVLDCRIFVRPSPVTGSLLVAEFVPRSGGIVDVSRLKGNLSASLPSYAVPQVWKAVNQLVLTENGKKQRT